MLLYSTDRPRLERHFRKDPALFGYHLGDLDDFHFANCQWMVDQQGREFIEVVLVYYGLDVPTVLAFGLTDRFPEFVREIAPLLPRRFHCHHRAEIVPFLAPLYSRRPLGRSLRMALAAGSQPPSGSDEYTIIRLDQSHVERLTALYRSSFPSSYFSPAMLATGKYLGIEEEGAIVAVAGVHCYSPKYRVAALGNVVTHKDHRGRGLATAVCGALSAELLGEGLDLCLNVDADNAAAIHCYEKLGFFVKHEFEESLFGAK